MKQHIDGFTYLLNKDREKEQKKKDASGRPDLREQYVSVPGHEVPIENFTRQSTVGKIAWAADAAGWEVKVGESEYVTAERWVKDAVVPGKPTKHNWVQAMSPDRKHLIFASKDLFKVDGLHVEKKEEVLIAIEVHRAADPGA